MDKQANLNKKLEVVSPVFRSGGKIPVPYTCRGQNINPPLNIISVPANTQSLTLVMHDPDAVSGDFLHWLVWDIPPVTETFPVNNVPVGAIQGKNGQSQKGYIGPCPPQGTGTHRYIFDFYALNTTLDLNNDSGLRAVLDAQEGHILDHFELVGLFSA